MQGCLSANRGSCWSECLVGFCEVWSIKKEEHIAVFLFVGGEGVPV